MVLVVEVVVVVVVSGRGGGCARSGLGWLRRNVTRRLLRNTVCFCSHSRCPFIWQQCGDVRCIAMRYDEVAARNLGAALITGGENRHKGRGDNGAVRSGRQGWQEGQGIRGC
ncbi:hypothetical protein E2C01_030082 [Portunus trituberculatus]|uniref:Secreted protein n=1 Tax=Portunus trituberculatus TaxID=210409 RepID=A0A5B7ETT4_PORTR|nr:hypothetical protein [Portunus trituberculatus]